jgi:hypothetical protein
VGPEVNDFGAPATCPAGPGITKEQCGPDRDTRGKDGRVCHQKGKGSVFFSEEKNQKTFMSAQA